MDKRGLIEKIVAHLGAELARYTQAARAAQADATDDQSRAENKYDTRGLEASYLAHGQSRQAVETARAREQFAALDHREFGPGEPVGIGALVELAGHGERVFYFFGPGAGGTEVVHAGQEVLVVTGQSPLGRQLAGKRAGENLPAEGYRIVAVR